MSDNYEGEKTGRIAMLCVTLVILGFFFFLLKADACSSCNRVDNSPPVCKDEFFELGNDGRYSNNNHTCYPGARVEVVASPPAPKPGIMCHCINKDQAGDAGQAPAK